MVDQTAYNGALRVFHTRCPKPVALVAPQATAGAIFMDEMVSVHRVHKKAPVTGRIRIARALNVGLGVRIQSGHRRDREHRPAAGFSRRESDFPDISAGVKPGNRDACSIGTSELTPHLYIERVPAGVSRAAAGLPG